MVLYSEIMVCDFNSGMELVSESDVIPHAGMEDIPRPDPPHPDPPNLPYPTPPPYPPPRLPALELPPGWRGLPRSLISSSFEVLTSGMWHNLSPGETRVKIDYSRVISFFDPKLSSLIEARTGKPRDQFRLDQISETDSKHIQDQLVDIFTRDGQGSGIDWGSITHVVTDRYGKRLELLQHILQNPDSTRNITERVVESRSQVLVMLTPYMLTSAIPPNPTGPVDRSWIDPVVKHCASTHTAWAPEGLLTPQEGLIKEAVEEVLFQICSVLGDIWVDAFDSERAGVKDLERFLGKWESEITELMDWLDWPIWSKCNPGCGPEVSSRFILLMDPLNWWPVLQETCYIPTWPWGYLPGRGGEEKMDMTPRCVEAVAPYSFLRHPP